MMLTAASDARVTPVRPRLRTSEGQAPLADLRFRSLIGERAWARLPAPVRARFGHRVTAGGTIVYAGEVVECRMSRCGRLLAQLLHPIGAPLPLARDDHVPAVVSVTEDAAGGGQFWTRIYGRGRSSPQVIQSAKRFGGPTGLEEHIGCGIGIALRVEEAGGAIHFLSDHYFLALGRLRLPFPQWLSPGRMRVSHVDGEDGCFAFVLDLHHPQLGELVHQTAVFHERTRPAGGKVS